MYSFFHVACDAHDDDDDSVTGKDPMTDFSEDVNGGDDCIICIDHPAEYVDNGNSSPFSLSSEHLV